MVRWRKGRKRGEQNNKCETEKAKLWYNSRGRRRNECGNGNVRVVPIFINNFELFGVCMVRGIKV